MMPRIVLPVTSRARILWPALGFPATVTPTARPSRNTMLEGDATTCVCVLVLSDHAALTSAHAARHLRYVSWGNAGDGIFATIQPPRFRPRQ